jgi:hypothetical protein
MTLGILAFAEGPLSSLGKQDALAVVTGQSIGTLTAASVTVTAGATVVETGQDLTTSFGSESVTAGATVVVSGQEITSTAASVSVAVIYNPTVTVTAFSDLNFVTGTYAVTAGGKVLIDASAEPDLDLYLGNETVTADANVSVSGRKYWNSYSCKCDSRSTHYNCSNRRTIIVSSRR